MVAEVGLDPHSDIDWVTGDDAIELFAQGKIDAFLSLPDSEDLRERNVGRVILNTTTDPPWSNYYCCMLAGHAEFVRNTPRRRSACCGPFSRPPRCAPPSRSG